MAQVTLFYTTTSHNTMLSDQLDTASPPPWSSDTSDTYTTMQTNITGGAYSIKVPYKFEVLLVTFSALGIPGNIGAIIVLLSGKELRRKVVNLFMVHQSIIDICGCVCTICTALITDVDLIPEGWGQDLYCRLFLTKTIMWILLHTSGYNLTYLTLERYWAITKPLKYNQDKVKQRLWLIFLSSWVLGVISMFPNIATSRMEGGMCIIFIDVKSKLILELITPFYTAVSCVIPAAIMFYAYGAIFLTLRKSMSFQKSDVSGPNEKLRQAENNLLQTCVILMLLFVLCWLQMAVVFMLFTIGYMELYTDYFHIANVCLTLNLCLNPFVYCARYQEFKDQTKYLLTIVFKRK